MAKKRAVKREGSAPEGSLEGFLSGAAAAREALTHLRGASLRMPGDDPFFDGLLARGAQAACAAGAKPEVADLIYFAAGGRVACVESLIAFGAPVGKVKVKALVDSGVSGGGVPWKESWMDCVRAMAGAGLRLRAKGEDPMMMQAIARVGNGPLEFLAEIGFDVHERDERGRDALMSAAEKGMGAAAYRLLKLGADASASDKAGRSVRDIAKAGIGSGCEEIYGRAFAEWEAEALKGSARAPAEPGGKRAPRI